MKDINKESGWGEIFIPLYNRIDELLQKKACITVAIDGPCGSGKSTLGELLKEKYDCNLFHMDDFFLQKDQRTKERLSMPGENVDHERFLAEVLGPVSRGEIVHYRRFDCHTLSILPETDYSPRRLSVIEGSYSMHKELVGYYDVTVFLDIDRELQRDRIIKRNPPEVAERFFSVWIPLENSYFQAFDIKNQADMVIEIK